MGKTTTSNEEIAQLLTKIADYLEAQDANVHRVRAYRNGAERVRQEERSVAEMVAEDEELTALKEIPGIGEGLARTIAEYVRTGRSGLLDRLQGAVSPQDLFVQVPAIGEELASRIQRDLGIDTLEELELAAYDGRLEEVEGFGPKRVESVRVSLEGMLSRSVRRRMRRLESGEELPSEAEEPPVEMLLDVDEEYRRRAREGELKKIAPRRFNPQDEAWLPILHTERGSWSFTALYSNTARAHELGTTHDWVVIYYQADGGESQATVVTAKRGALEGKRVVRGREEECARHYKAQREGEERG